MNKKCEREVCKHIAKFREEIAKLPEENRPYWDALYEAYLQLSGEYDMLKELGIPYIEKKARKEMQERCIELVENEKVEEVGGCDDVYNAAINHSIEAIRKMEGKM